MYVLLNLIVNLLIPDASIQFISRKVRFIICINNKTIFTTRRAASRLNNKRESPRRGRPGREMLSLPLNICLFSVMATQFCLRNK